MARTTTKKRTTANRPTSRKTTRKTARRTTRAARPARDVEEDYSSKQFIAKLRRLADCIEQGKRFQIQIAGERISIPPDAVINLEHERGGGEEEVEFQLKWILPEA